MGCSGDTPRLGQAAMDAALLGLPNWSQSMNGEQICCERRFSNYAKALAFVNAVSLLAEAANHHPDIEFGWGYARIHLSTHSIGGVSALDMQLAAQIDGVA